MEAGKISNKIAQYLSRHLSDLESKEVEALILENDDWQLELNQQEKLLNLINSSETVEPPSNMKDDFEVMLKMEIGVDENTQKSTYWNSTKMWLQIAASISILAIGYFIGTEFTQQSANKQLATLQKEVADTKKLVISSLQNKSASTRLNAVNASNTLKQMDRDIFMALINTLNTDENVNVRIAALDALSQFGEQEKVRKALIEALAKQDKPAVQIVLINLLVKLNEKRAIQSLERMIEDENMIEAVRDEASFGVFKLS